MGAAPTSNPLPAPPTMALSELLKTQLDLTENFLRAQKRLYSRPAGVSASDCSTP